MEGLLVLVIGGILSIGFSTVVVWCRSATALKHKLDAVVERMSEDSEYAARVGDAEEFVKNNFGLSRPQWLVIAVEHAVQPLLLVALFAAFFPEGLAAYPGWLRATALSLVICLLIVHETVAVPHLWSKKRSYRVFVAAFWVVFVLGVALPGLLEGVA